MHRSIYINKNNGINIACLLGAFVFTQILPLLIWPLAGTKLHVHAAVVHKRFLVHKQPQRSFFLQIFFSRKASKSCRISTAGERKNKTWANLWKGNAANWTSKCTSVSCAASLHMQEKREEGKKMFCWGVWSSAGSCVNLDKLMSLEATFFPFFFFFLQVFKSLWAKERTKERKCEWVLKRSIFQTSVGLLFFFWATLSCIVSDGCRAGAGFWQRLTGNGKNKIY